MRYVYAMELSDGTVKIGVTGGMKKRIQAVQRERGAQVTRTKQVKFLVDKGALAAERRCHKTFETKKVVGEYFAISFEEACTELEKIESESEDFDIRARIAKAIFSAKFYCYSRRKFAENADLPAPRVFNFEHGKEIPSVIDIFKLARAHDISADYLLGLIDEPHSINIKEQLQEAQTIISNKEKELHRIIAEKEKAHAIAQTMLNNAQELLSKLK